MSILVAAILDVVRCARHCEVVHCEVYIAKAWRSIIAKPLSPRLSPPVVRITCRSFPVDIDLTVLYSGRIFNLVL